MYLCIYYSNNFFLIEIITILNVFVGRTQTTIVHIDIFRSLFV